MRKILIVMMLVTALMMFMSVPARAEMDLAGGKLSGYLTAGKLFDVNYSLTVDQTTGSQIDTIMLSSPREQILIGGEVRYTYKSVSPFLNYFTLTGKNTQGDFSIRKSLLFIGTDVEVWKSIGIRTMYFQWLNKVGEVKEISRYLYTGLIVKF